MFTIKNIVTAAALSVVAATSANAATISVETFSAAAYEEFATFGDLLGQETFESYAVAEGAIAGSSVGSFVTLGGTGEGGSVIGTGTEVAVNDDTTFGRANTTVGGANWLDSNDTLGILWTATLGGETFNRIAFSLSDAADQGATLSITADGEELTTVLGRGNGEVDWVVVSFGGFVSTADIHLINSKLNDGFGIDDASISAVPVPAAGLMLLTALGGTVALRRRKKA